MQSWCKLETRLSCLGLKGLRCPWRKAGTDFVYQQKVRAAPVSAVKSTRTNMRIPFERRASGVLRQNIYHMFKERWQGRGVFGVCSSFRRIQALSSSEFQFTTVVTLFKITIIWWYFRPPLGLHLFTMLLHHSHNSCLARVLITKPGVCYHHCTGAI